MATVNPTQHRELARVREIQTLCLEKLAIRIDSAEVDLFATGVMDSMSLVQLLLELERHFGIELPMHEIDIGSFRTLKDITEIVARHRDAAAPSASAMLVT